MGRRFVALLAIVIVIALVGLLLWQVTLHRDGSPREESALSSRGE